VYLSFTALNPDGSIKWTYTTGSPIYASAAIGADGKIYIGSLDKHLYALHPDGSLAWSQATAGAATSPVIAADGRLYVGNSDGQLYAFGD
jgi:outer membrane protein assembly factor BamB